MDPKRWYASKTIWFSVLLCLVSVAGLFGFQDFQPDGRTADTIGVIVSVVGIILRYVTTQPITASRKQE